MCAHQLVSVHPRKDGLDFLEHLAAFAFRKALGPGSSAITGHEGEKSGLGYKKITALSKIFGSRGRVVELNCQLAMPWNSVRAVW